MAEHKKYNHKRFSDQDSIRLLQLQPGAFDDDIRITLIEAPLSKPPKYEALSYVWGSPTPDSAISCHGLELLVTENCVLAMRRLRRHIRTRLLWIDAICIDQTSDEEKQHQVQLMGDVYSKAEEVIIWLGEKCAYSDFVMALLKDYYAIRTSIWRRPIRVRLLNKQIRKLRQAGKKAARKDEPGSNIGQIMESITLRSWFTRVWTIQEYVMSRRALLVCGNKIIDIERFFKALSDLDLRLEDQCEGYEIHILENVYIKSYNLFFCRLRHSLVQRDFDPTKVSLTALFGYVQYRISTNRRDSIDGLYGIIKKFHPDFPLPDYSRSIRDIFTAATKCVIRHDRSLFLLVGITGEMTDFPSWVPDWSKEPESTFSIAEEFLEGYRASRKSTSIFRFLNGDNCLSVHGVIIDTITCCTALAIEVPGGIRDMKKNLNMDSVSKGNIRRLYLATQKQFQQWVILANNLNNHAYHRYPTGVTVNQALCRILVLDDVQENIEGDNSGAYDYSGFEEWLLAHSLGVSDEFVKDIYTSLERRFPGKLPTLESCVIAPGTDASDMGVEILMLNLEVRYYLVNVIILSIGTKFFTTSAQYMGKALPSAQEGDVVMLISGVDYPIIARKRGETYQLVSPAYVCGIMHGQKWPDNGEDLMDIVLS